MALGMLRAGRRKVDHSQSGLGRVGNGRQSCEQKSHQEQEACCMSDMATRNHRAEPFTGVFPNGYHLLWLSWASRSPALLAYSLFGKSLVIAS